MTEARIRSVGLAWAGLMAVIAVLLAAAVNAGALRLSDHVLLFAAQAPASRPLDLLMTGVSLVGTIEVTSILVLILVLTARSASPLRWERWVPLALFVLVTAVEVLSKSLVHQPPPPLDLLRGLRLPGLSVDTSFSFPSGHMTRVTLVAALFTLRLVRRTRQATWLWVCVGAVWLIGYSRVYLGEHWPADVAGGILLGGFALSACLAISPRGSVGDFPPDVGGQDDPRPNL